MNCYILIGGRGRRMGQAKTGLAFGESTFLDRVTAAARQAFDAVYAVQRPAGPDADGLPTIHEAPHEKEAPIFGVACALEHANTPCFVLAVDYPLLDASLLRYLRERFERSAARLVAPRWDDKLQMLCAGYRPELLPRIVTRIASSRLDLRGIAAEVESEVIEESELRRRFAGEPLMNVNTPEELQQARRRI